MRWLVALLIASPAFGQSCQPTSFLKAYLTEEYGERPIFVGMVSETQILEIWGNDQTESWTVFISMANGVSCIRSNGKGIATISPVGKRL